MVKVLIAEDDLLMADMLSEILVDAGYEVCGIARTVEQGIKLAELLKPDIALLDLRLAAGGLGTEIAARLDRTGRLGILYCTGNAGQIKLTKEDGDAALRKPYMPADVLRALQIVLEIATTGKATGQFPNGFLLLGSDLGGQMKRAEPGKDTRDEAIARLIQQQAALASYGSFALLETDLGKVLTEGTRRCAESWSVPFCKICRYRSEENDLILESGVGWNPGVIGVATSRADRSTPQGRTFVTAEPVICIDIGKDVSFLPPSFYAEHGIVSTLSVVIRRKGGQPWGVLEVDSASRLNYDVADINFLTGFANVMAEAVDTSKRNSIVLAAMDKMKDMVADRDRLLAAQARLLAEKGVLAQELQHRVRNNLQLVFGMLNKQALAPEDGTSAEAISAIARRVMTLAKVYDHLLGAGLTRTIEFGSYLASLCESFKDMENPNHHNIALSCVWEPLMLDLDTATALGLIVAELLSNSYRHAFPNGTGTISVALRVISAGAGATIAVIDNGVGFSQTGNSNRRGLGLVKRLMQQVEGSADLHSDGCTEWTLRFPVPARTDSHDAADDVLLVAQG